MHQTTGASQYIQIHEYKFYPALLIQVHILADYLKRSFQNRWVQLNLSQKLMGAPNAPLYRRPSQKSELPP